MEIPPTRAGRGPTRSCQVVDAGCQDYAGQGKSQHLSDSTYGVATQPTDARRTEPLHALPRDTPLSGLAPSTSPARCPIPSYRRSSDHQIDITACLSFTGDAARRARRPGSPRVARLPASVTSSPRPEASVAIRAPPPRTTSVFAVASPRRTSAGASGRMVCALRSGRARRTSPPSLGCARRCPVGSADSRTLEARRGTSTPNPCRTAARSPASAPWDSVDWAGWRNPESAPPG